MLLRRVGIALVGILGFVGSALGQSQRYDLPTDAMLGRLGLQRAWWGFATIDSIRDRVKFFVTDEQVTVVESATGTVTEFDNATGRRRWAIQVGAATDVRYQPGTTEQHVLVVSGTKLYAIDKQTGDAAWEVILPSAPSSGPSSDNTRAYVGAVDGTVFAYDLTFLSQLTKDTSLGKQIYRSLAWQYRTAARIPFPIVSTGTIACVASDDGSLYGLEIKNHRPRFQFETDKPLAAPIGQLGTQIVVATNDQKVYSLNAETGALKWELLMGLHVRQQPRIIADHVFVCSDGGGMRCLNAQNGREVWGNRQANRFLAATPAYVYVSTTLDDVLILSQANGRQVGSFALRGFPIRIANDRTDRMFFASERGLVLCVRERERDYPLFHKQPEKRPVDPEVAPDEPGAKPKAAAKPAPSKKKADESDEAMEEKKDPDAAPAVPAKSATKPPRSKPAKKALKAKLQKPATDSE